MTVHNKLKKAIIKSMTGKLAVYIAQLVSLIILARLFTPEQFGIVAAAMIFVMFFELMTSRGLAPAIVYKKKFENRERDGIFTFTLILGLLLSVLFIGLAEPIFNWFGFKSGIEVFYVLAGYIFFSAISTMPLASLQKDTRFHSMAGSEVIAELLSLAFCLYLYFLDYTYIALAAKVLSVSFIRFIFYYLFSRTTEIGGASIGKNIGAIRHLYQFAKYQLAFNFLNYFSRNLDQILIGKYFGAITLGGYEKVIQVIRYPMQLFTFAITPALQPILTKHQEQPEIVEDAYYKVIFKLALMGLFIATITFWGASEAIYILFGDQWNMVAPMLGLLSISIPLQMVLSSTGGIFQAFGKTKEQFMCGLFSSCTNVSAIVLGIYMVDVLILCMLLPLAFLVNYFQAFFVLHRSIFSFREFKPFFLVTLIVVAPYLNYFFYFSINYQLPESYLAAFSNLIKISLISLIILTLLYIIGLQLKKQLKI